MGIDKRRLTETFSELVSIDSPSFGERGMADHLKARLISLGLAITEDDAGKRLGGNCGNIHGFLEGDGGLEPILFCAHMDTIEPSRGKRAVIGGDGVIRSGGDTVLGADDLTAVAAILEALAVLRERGLPHRPIEVLFTVAEEVYCKGAGQFDCSALRSKEAYVLDLSGPAGTAAYKAPTILTFTATVRGRAAHAGFAPQSGIHAIAVAADAVSELPMGRLGEDTTLNVGLVSGGLATNIVPERCEVRGEIRSFSHERALAQAHAVKRRFEDSAERYGAAVDFELTTHCVAYETPLSHPVVRRFEGAGRRIGTPAALISTFGGSDNNVLSLRGVTGLVVACAMYQCHSCGEYTVIDELARVAELTLALMTGRE